MSFSWAFQWYHFHLDPIWPDGTFKFLNVDLSEIEEAGGFEVEGRETNWKIRGKMTIFSLALLLFSIVFGKDSDD